MAERDTRWRLAADQLRAIAGLDAGILPPRLLARGLSAEKPIVILSGNSIDHALLAFGALYAGIPFCPVSPAYSLVSKDYGKLGLPDEAADARPGVRRRRHEIRRRARRPMCPPEPRSPRRAAPCPAAT